MRSRLNWVRMAVSVSTVIMLLAIMLAPTMAHSGSPAVPVRSVAPPRYIPAITGTHGVVASARSIAPAVGLQVLMNGGNAIDAAVTTAAMVTLTELTMSGIGGHGTMMVYWAKTGEVMALDFGTFLPHAFTIDQWGSPPTYPPSRDVVNTMLPGTLAGWAEALDKLGTISLAEALAPAIRYAEEGIPIDRPVASVLERNADLILAAFPEAAKVWMPNGRPPRVGEILKFPDLAATYRLISEKGPDVFYKGELGDKIVAYLNENGSRFTKEEFANYKPIWREVLSTTYRDEYEVFAIKNQNFSPAMLTMFNIWENFDMQKLGATTPDGLHVVIEAGKAAIGDRTAYYGDPDFSDVPYDILISKEYGAKRASEIKMDAAIPEKPGEFPGLTPPAGISGMNPNPHVRDCTTNIAVADKDHNIVLITQTLGAGLGSMHIVPGTGITLNNEGTYFNLDPVNGPNYPGPGKRVENQMGGAIILKNGKPWAGIGAPGGERIPLDIATALMRMIEYGVRIQEAIEMPRATYIAGGTVQLERDALPWETVQELYDKGHRLTQPGSLVGLSGVYIDPETGVLEAGAEPSRGYTRAGF
jgi:gamma-glutamyltranspeptidase/glutathione hydrolase